MKIREMIDGDARPAVPLLKESQRDFRELSLAEVLAEIRAVAEGAKNVFADLDEAQLNWKPDPNRWSVGQCFEHLVTSNRLMVDAAKSAIANPPSSIWQKWRWWSKVWGREMIRTQGPVVGRKFTTPAKSTPPSHAPADIVARFITQHHELDVWIRGLDEARVGAIMASPFVGIITYSVMDGLRLLVAHDWRHLEQARRVLAALPGEPAVADRNSPK
jgi:hypothetical protein